MSFAICLNLDQCKILSSGNGFKIRRINSISILLQTEVIIWAIFKLSSADAFNLVAPKFCRLGRVKEITCAEFLETGNTDRFNT